MMAASALCLLLSFFFSLCLFIEVCVYRLSLRGSPAALSQLQPLSISARLFASAGPLLRLGQRGSGLRPHRPPSRVSRLHALTHTHQYRFLRHAINILSKTAPSKYWKVSAKAFRHHLNCILTAILLKVFPLGIRSSIKLKGSLICRFYRHLQMFALIASFCFPPLPGPPPPCHRTSCWKGSVGEKPSLISLFPSPAPVSGGTHLSSGPLWALYVSAGAG